jgi:diaminopimelate epimerase
MRTQTIELSKLSGSGNDFILIDNRAGVVDETRIHDFVVGLCRRRMSVGADGLILIEPPREGHDFRWRFFNADGSAVEMCGNGARCAARFAHLSGIAGPRLSFETDAGVIHAEVDGDRVRIRMPDATVEGPPFEIPLAVGSMTVSRIHTGVPHVVIPVPDADRIDVVALGREIRWHRAFEPDGVNVNFVSPDGSGGLYNRTYERGVEDETLACGTGSVASALVMSSLNGVRPPVSVRTRSGARLTVGFGGSGGRYSDIFLEGDARFIYKGELGADAWQ